MNKNNEITANAKILASLSNSLGKMNGKENPEDNFQKEQKFLQNSIFKKPRNINDLVDRTVNAKESNLVRFFFFLNIFFAAF